MNDRKIIPESELIGKRFNDLEIIGAVGEYYGKTRTKWRVRCLRCGREYTIFGSNIGKTQCCRQCTADNLIAGKQKLKKLIAGGSAVPSVSQNRQLNKNSKTGYRGISLMKNGHYRAYINFKRKQYHLGCYENINDAIATRAAADEQIYGDFLKWFAKTYPDVWAGYRGK